MTSFADILFYLVVCLVKRCTHCGSEDDVERLVYEEPSGWVWACKICRPDYERMFAVNARRGRLAVLA